MQTDTLEGFRLSPLQKRLWLLQQDGRLYGSQAVVTLEGELDREGLRAALAAVAGEHEILRTTFSALPGMEVPLQVIGEPAPPAVREVDLGTAAHEEEIGNLLEADREAVVDFARGPLLRVTLAGLGPRRHALLLTVPALCADARALEVVVREVARSYASGPRLSGGLIQYADFSEWQHELLQAEDGEKGRKHWRRASFPDPAAIRLPFEREPATTAGFSPRAVSVRMDATAVAALDAVAARYELDPADVLLACWQAVLWRRTNEAELTLGVFFDGRKYDDLRHAVGLFGKYLPVAVQIQEDRPLAQLARQCREAASTAADWQEYFVWELTGCEERSIFAFGFEHVDDLFDEPEAAGVRFAISRLASCTDYFKVRLACRRVNGELALDFWYDPRLYAEEAVQLLGRAFAALLREALERPEAPVGSLTALGPQERLRLVAEWNDTACAFPPSSLLALFAAQAERSPDALAVVFADRSMSYAELDRESNRLARHLRRLGVREEDRVVLFLDRSIDLVVGLLGTLKAGGAFVPLDPGQPMDRLQSMFQDAVARAVLTEERLAERLPASTAAVVRLDADREQISHLGSGPIEIEVSPDQLAYVIFTSGSTGRPKGTLLERGALVNLAHALDRSIYAGRTSPLRVSVNAPLSFDASIKQVTRLLFGDALYIVPEEIRPDGGALLAWLSRHRVDVLDCTPSQLQLLLAAGFEQAAVVPGRVLVGGEAVGAALWDRLAASERSCFFDVYGPTECTVDTTWCAVQPGAPTIGRPLSNVAVYVIDERGDLAPLGMPGELHVGGAGLARGYLERPGLTAEKFVPDPWGKQAGARLYRTGDLVRYREDGSLEYLGRIDHQVKLRGFRIELGEIERALERHPAVDEALVLIREDAPGDQRLTAYVVPRQRAAGQIGDRPSYTLPNGMTVAHQNRNETEYLYREIFEEGCYVKHGIALPENSCVFDVGANIGMFSLFVSQVCPTASIYAFEPIPPIFESLSLNTDLYVPGVRRFPFGLSSEAKVAPFTYYPRYTMMSSLADYADPEGEMEVIRRFLRNEERGGAGEAAALAAELDELLAERFEGETHRCMLRRLGDVIREEGVERIDLLKIDVQRAELEVLQGLREEDWSKLQQIVMEVHDEEGGQTAGRIVVLRDLLASRGFDVIVEQDEFLAGTDRYNLYAARTGGGLRRGAEPVRVLPLAQPAAAALSAGALREFLRPLLPDVMIPAAVVLLDRFPLTRNGKVDRAALPAPEVAEESAVREVTPPRTPFEELLVGTWSEILGIERIDVTDNFFDLGGHSLLATQLMSRVRQVFRVDVPLRTLFESPTLEELARAVEQAHRGEERSIEPVPRDRPLPLSFAQQRLWFLNLLQPGSAAYNSSTIFRLTGDLRVDVLERGVTEMVRRHETLRTVFEAVDGVPVQRILPARPYLLTVVDLSRLSTEEKHLEFQRLARREAAGPFDLRCGPLWRFSLARLADGEHVAHFSLHHSIADGWSMGILIRELTALYEAFLNDRPSPLPPLEIQYADYAWWQRQWLQGEVLEALLAYWRRQLAGAPPRLDLPMDRPRPALQTFAGAVQMFQWSPALSQSLRLCSRGAGVTLFMTLLTGFQALLRRYTGLEDISIGTAIANRNRLEAEGLIGLLVNTLVLRVAVPGDPAVLQLLKQVRDVCLDAYAHQDVPFEKLVEELQPQRSLSHAPLFQVGFDLQNLRQESLQLRGVQVSRMINELSASKFDLTLSMDQSAGLLHGAIEYNPDLFDNSTIQRLLGHLESVLAAVAADPSLRIAELPLLGEGERHQVVIGGNDTRRPYPNGDRTLHELFEAQAERTPEAVAVSSEEGNLRYGELERRANQLARFLRRLDVGPEVRVGVAVERSLEMVVGVLGVLKAGGAYVPLDPEAPPGRLALMLEDSGVRVVLSQERLAGALPEGEYERVWLDADGERISRESGGRLASAVDGDHLAYVIYTSGSTGRPKGVMISHRSILNRLLWMQERFPLTPGDILLQKTPLAFDASVWELFVPLFAGARLELARPGGQRDSEYLVRRVREAGVTVLQLVPSQLRVFLDEPGAAECASLRRLFCGGEVLPESLREHAFARLGAELCNLYGPTETSIDASSERCVRGESGGNGAVPIGRALGNVRLYLLGGEQSPVPLGVTGELYIGGVNLARGYAGRPDLTAERFVPDGVSSEVGERLYRTGDQARYLADGRIECLGRLDHQVKVRGVRIEPGEIEALLRRHPAVREAAVVVREDAPGDPRLVAYAVAGRGEAAESAAAPAGGTPEIWPCVGEYQIYDELLYWAMIKDERRNTLYRRAIERLVPGRVVLDIGTGREAIWARYCAEAGARKVYAVEILDEAYEHAAALVERLGLAGRITVLRGDIAEIELPEKVDVCVSNLIGTIGGSEGAARILSDARRLVAADGDFIPRRCATRIAAVTLPEELRRDPGFPPVGAHYVERIFAEVGHPFDVRLCIRSFPLENVVSTSEVFEDLDFSAPVDARFERAIRLTVRKDATLDGFLLWLELQTIEGEVIDTLHHEHSWLPVYLPVFGSGVAVTAGDVLEVLCRGELCADGIHPDYEVRGRLLRGHGPGESFRFVSSHHDPVFRSVPLYRSLFSDGGPRVLAGAAAPGPSERELRAHLRDVLPEYLIPSRIVLLESLPLTPSGKLDRRALPAPDRTAENAGEGTGARNLIEELLVSLWQEILGLGQVGVHDDFFALGGHSLLATRVVSRIRSAVQVDLEVRDLFEAPTIARLTQRIGEAKRSGTGVAAPPLAPGPRGGRYPLSFAQERMWFLHRLAPESAAYNITIAVKLDGRLDRGALTETLGEIVRRHEVLRARFAHAEGDPWQEIEPFRPVPAPLVDLSDLPAAVREARSAALAAQETAIPFELETCPPFRVSLVRLAAMEHLLLLSLHHIVSDAWSQGVLIREVAVLYPSFAQGKAPVLQPLPVQYSDFAAWQRSWLQGEVLAAHRDWWRERLQGAPALLLLPTDRPRSTVWSARGATRRLTLPASLTTPVRELSRAQGATPFMTLLALFEVLLSRWSGETDLSIGTPVAGRDRMEIEGLIGLFLNTLVLRTDLGGGPAFGEVVKRVRETALGAHAHQALPFEKLVDDLAPRRDLGHSPLFQVLFDYQNPTRDALELPGLQLSRLDVETRTAKFDLSLSMSESGGRFYGSLQYATDLFDASTIDRLLGHFEVLLAGAAAAPERRIDELPLLGQGERHQLLVWNDTAAPYAGSERCLHELIEQQAWRSPDRVAIEVEGEALTYGELWRRSRLLGRSLQRLGVGPEARVGLCLERSLELMVGLLGILQAGGAYVPLDPEYPRERLAYMLEDSGARVVLLQGRLAGVLPEGGVRRVLLDADWRTIERQAARVPEAGVSPENLAYVIYTSGSTGWPKGAMNTHRGIVNRLLWMQSTYGLDETDAVLQKTPASFDVSVWEFFWPLLAGARLVMARPGGHREGEYLVERIVSAHVTTVHFVPSMLRVFLETAGVERCAGGLRRVMASGEALTGDLEQRFLAHLGSCELHNLYGPTEAAVDVTSWRCLGDRGERGVPIGRPIANTQIHLLDAAGEAVPVGVSGELYIGGVSLARGYSGRPELTAERFVPSPQEIGARLYRTGDLARWHADGAIEYVGRVDHQVKIRGFRIELGEIEAALDRHPGVAATVVAMREESPGDRRLVAYVVAANGKAPGAEELRRGLQERLPEHMVPAAFVFLESLPLTPSGKVDRRALPAPGVERPELAVGYVAPCTPVEEVLAGIWERVLRLERVGAHDDFFALGGHSLLATQVASRIRNAFGVELPLRALFEAVTLSRLAARIESSLGAAAVVAPPLLRAPREEDLPLSFAQERLWFLDQLEPGNPAYNIPLMVRLTGELEIAVLRRSFAELLRRHEALRTSFPAVRGRARQVVHDGMTLPLPVVDLSALSAPQRSAELRKVAREEAQRPFDLFRPLPLRALALRLKQTEQAVLLCVHHIVSDGWSMGVLIEELGRLYEAFRAGLPSPLPELPIQYADFAAWQRRWLTGEVLAEQLVFWRQQLAGAPPVLELPVDRPRPPVPSYRGASRPLALPAGTAAALRLYARARNATPFMVLLTAWYGFLARVSSQSDVLVGTPIAGRNRLETERLIGLFVNTLVLRADLSDDPPLAGLLDQVRARTLEAHAHQDLPFEKLVNELGVLRDLGHAPLFQVMFVFQNTPRVALEFAGLALSELPIESGTAKFDLTLALEDDEGGIAGSLRYAKDLFDSATIVRWLGQLVRLLEGMLADPSLRLSELPLLSEAEAAQLDAWNDTAAEYPLDRCLHELVEEQTDRAPDAIAAAWEEGQITYGELELKSNQLAHWLRSQGVGPEVPVAISVERSPEMLVGLLGILKSGGYYVPLDPEYPAARLSLMQEDAGAPVLLTQRRLAGSLPQTGSRVVCLDADWPAVAAASGERPVLLSKPDNLTYAIYTSGSTGRPKGVMAHHKGIVNRLVWTQRAYPVTAADRILHKASFSFDFSVWECFMPLLVGARVVLARPGGQRDPGYLARTVAEHEITLLHFVPSMLQAFLSEEELPGYPGLRYVIAGGEALAPELRDLVFSRLGKVLRNQYGPTEVSIDTTDWICRSEDRRRTVPIGRPMGNVSTWIVGPQGELQPMGVVGELSLGGEGVARGYLGRPELTADRFVPDPFSRRPGARLYRTGDLARWLPDGSLEFLGRIDHQVKVRGFRIELGEIESVLRQKLGVGSALVVLREDAPGHRRLVAYLVAGTGGRLPGIEELRGRLREWLPEHMVPSAFVLLESLPLTPSGKVDRRALPAPGGDRPGLETAYVAPLTGVEEALAEVWRRVLRLDRVGVQDNFFALGGDSILAIQIVAWAAEAGLRLQSRHLFQYQTVAELAAVAEAAQPPAGTGDEAVGDVALTPIQHWFFERHLEAAHHFNQSVLLAARERLAPEALRAALGDLLARHGALRLRFEERQGEWRSRYADSAADLDGSPLAVLDLSLLPKSMQGPAVTAACAAAQASLDLGRGPLLRGVWLDLGEERGAERPGRLLLVVHHLAVDGVSWRILLAELERAYRSRLRGEAPRPGAATSSYRRWAEQLEQYARSERVLAEAPYWLSSEPPGRLPVDFAGGENRMGAVRTVLVSLDEEETRALLQQVPGVYRTRIQEVLLTALVEAFATWTGERRVAVDLEGHGREEVGEEIDVSRTVGWFTTIYPVVLDLRRICGAGESLKAVKEQLRAVPQQGLGYGLLRYLSGDRDLQRRLASLPDREVSFNYLGQLDQVLEEGSAFVSAPEPAGPERAPQQARCYLLEVNGRVMGGRLHLSWRYGGEVHRQETVEGLAARFVASLRALIAHCLSAEAGGYTPSDFPLVKLDGRQLERVLGTIGKIKR